MTESNLTRRVAWVGTPREYVIDDFGDRMIDHEVEVHREIPLNGRRRPITMREVGPADGLSRSYVFGQRANGGPEGFVQDMTDADADTLLNGPSGENFRDVTHDPNFASKFYRSFESIARSNG